MEGTSTHSFNICPKAPHGSPIQCCNMRRRIGEHQIILEEQTSLEEGRSAKPGPGSQIGAVGRCEGEGKAIHSFNICPKAPHGSPIQCCNMRRRIGEHQIILEEQTSLEEGRSAKPGPGRQIRAVGRHEGEGKAIHSFNICPKAPHGSQIQCCNMRRRIGEHQIILEYQTSLELLKCQTWPRQPNWSCWSLQSGGKCHPFLQYMPKGSPWVPNTMLQHA